MSDTTTHQERDEALHDAWCYLDTTIRCLRDADARDLRIAALQLRMRIGDRRFELSDAASRETADTD